MTTQRCYGLQCRERVLVMNWRVLEMNWKRGENERSYLNGPLRRRIIKYQVFFSDEPYINSFLHGFLNSYQKNRNSPVKGTINRLVTLHFGAELLTYIKAWAKPPGKYVRFHIQKKKVSSRRSFCLLLRFCWTMWCLEINTFQAWRISFSQPFLRSRSFCFVI